MRILLSEGSGLTSRQTAGLLAASGHRVGVLSSDRTALTRWTRAVSAWHRVPPFGPDPLAWLDAALAVAARHGYEMLLPTQEQAAVMSWAVDRGAWPAGLATAVPAFASLARVQDKLSAARTLDAFGVPRPRWAAIRDPGDAADWDAYPAFVKTPIGTASAGVRRVRCRGELAAALRAGPYAEALRGGGLLLEQEIDGPLAMVQAVFDRGRLVAFHANKRVAEGAGGGACHKESVLLPGVRDRIAQLGRGLGWHGALSADVIADARGRHVVIDVNPRLVEPVNAWRSGTDLVGALVDAARGRPPADRPSGRGGVRTHQLLLSILGVAERTGSRRAVWREVVRASRHSGLYRGSAEELTPIRRDVRAAVPVVVALALASLRPSLGGRMADKGTGAYSITPQGWDRLVRDEA